MRGIPIDIFLSMVKICKGWQGGSFNEGSKEPISIMDIYTWVIFLYVAGTLTVGWFLFHEVGPSSHRRKDKVVGPTYWGIYTGSSFQDGEKTIALQEFKDEELDGLCGGRAYSSGKAVKSGRC